jgi:hypothetical protein
MDGKNSLFSGEKVDFFSLFWYKFSWFFSRFFSEKVAFLVYFFASPILHFFLNEGHFL